MRLQFNPHDADAHRQLIEQLRKKYAFRAIVAENTTWLANNRSDSWALIELISTSEVALHDPEYAITQLRLQLAAVQRKDDPEDYNDWADQDIAEYAVMLSVILVIVVGTIQLIGGNANNFFFQCS
jgi:hypothetical protein